MTLDGWILKLVYELNGYGIVFYVLITSLVSVVLSFAVGLERQLRGKSINIKTHVLLAAGCSLLMAVSIWGIRVADGTLNIVEKTSESFIGLSYDTSRIAAAVITGMGFLGAGAIMKDKLAIRGLSTAAALWVSASLGLACGAGFILESIIFTIFIMIIHIVINHINAFISKRAIAIYVTADRTFPVLEVAEDIAVKNRIPLRDYKIIESNEDHNVILLQFLYQTDVKMVDFYISQLERHDEISEIHYR